MSQIILPISSSPTVPTSFTGNNGTVGIPAANNINLLGAETSANNDNGIKTEANPNLSNNFLIELTNRIQGTGTTTDNTTVIVLFTFPLGTTDGTYLLDSKLVVYNLTDGISAAFSSKVCVRTTGSQAFLISTDNFFISEEGAMSNLDIANIVDQAGNTFSVEVTGLAGKTVHYRVLTGYIFVS